MSDAQKKVKRMFGMFGAPPSPDEVVGNLQIPHKAPVGRAKGEPTTQLNLRVPVSTKRRIRVLAARDSISLSEVVLRSLELYEERYGRAPEL